MKDRRRGPAQQFPPTGSVRGQGWGRNFVRCKAEAAPLEGPAELTRLVDLLDQDVPPDRTTL